MTNQQLKAHCEDVIANPQDHLDWVVDMARVALASLEAEPVYQFIVNNPDHDGYIEWADCNADYYSKEPSDSRRLLYTAPPAAGLKPIELKKGALMISAYATDPMNADPVLCLSKEGVIEAIRAAGYEVKA